MCYISKFNSKQCHSKLKSKLMRAVKSLSKNIAKKIATSVYRLTGPRKSLILNTQIIKGRRKLHLSF